jgi:hypothetical protein
MASWSCRCPARLPTVRVIAAALSAILGYQHSERVDALRDGYSLAACTSATSPRGAFFIDAHLR